MVLSPWTLPHFFTAAITWRSIKLEEFGSVAAVLGHASEDHPEIPESLVGHG